MNRQQKEAAVAHVEELFSTSHAAFLVKYKGLSVKQLQSLRRGLRTQNGTFTVTKARLMKIAAERNIDKVQHINAFKENFREQVGLVFSLGNDTPALIKSLVTFAKENEELEIIAGLFEQRLILNDEIRMLASLPSREVLLAMLAGTLQAPIASLARALNEVVTQRSGGSLNAVAESEETNG